MRFGSSSIRVDGLLLREPSGAEVARFVGGAALVEKVIEARLVDQTLQQLARRRLFRQIMLHQFDAFVFEEGDRLPTARSTRLDVDVEYLHSFDFFFWAIAWNTDRPGLPNFAAVLRAAESGRRSAGNFRDSENWRSEAGRGMRGLFTSGGAMIPLEF